MDGVLVVVLQALPVAEMAIKAAVRGSVLLLEESQMPFADRMGRVAVPFQVLRQKGLVQWKAPRFGLQDNNVLHACGAYSNYLRENIIPMSLIQSEGGCKLFILYIYLLLNFPLIVRN